MSLVAYGSSSDEEEEDEAPESDRGVQVLVQKTKTVLTLPNPKHADETTPSPRLDHVEDLQVKIVKDSGSNATDDLKLFKNLPKPKHLDIDPEDEVETKSSQEKPLKKNRGPVKISLPSLSEFKDVDEEAAERKKTRVKPSEKGTGLFAILPPPRGSLTKATVKSLIPDIVKKVSQSSLPVQLEPVKRLPRSEPKAKDKIPLTSVNYDSDSDEEGVGKDDAEDKREGKAVDFFSLASNNEPLPIIETTEKDVLSLSGEQNVTVEVFSTNSTTSAMSLNRNLKDFSAPLSTEEFQSGEKMEQEEYSAENQSEKREGAETGDTILTSNVINLPKEEIRLKNKAEVGPKLPLPEQEYNVDSQGNVAFDEKAIEYLCGKRGVKRKNKDFDEANIIEINGEDIKPDEREWLVKALTEEPAERPGSQGPGPSTQSRKKHQITYLAHQAKAMEVELKNQWAQNRVTRKQTQSKYGF